MRVAQNTVKFCISARNYICQPFAPREGPRGRFSTITWSVRLSHLASPSARCDRLKVFESYPANSADCSLAEQMKNALSGVSHFHLLALLKDFRTLDWAEEYKYPTVILSQMKQLLAEHQEG